MKYVTISICHSGGRKISARCMLTYQPGGQIDRAALCDPARFLHSCYERDTPEAARAMNVGLRIAYDEESDVEVIIDDRRCEDRSCANSNQHRRFLPAPPDADLVRVMVRHCAGWINFECTSAITEYGNATTKWSGSDWSSLQSTPEPSPLRNRRNGLNPDAEPWLPAMGTPQNAMSPPTRSPSTCAANTAANAAEPHDRWEGLRPAKLTLPEGPRFADAPSPGAPLTQHSAHFPGFDAAPGGMIEIEGNVEISSEEYDWLTTGLFAHDARSMTS
jgi:hypothetical protein